MKKIIELFELADKKFREGGIDMSQKGNRTLLYDTVLAAYSIGASCATHRIDGINPLVKMGNEYINKGLEALKASASKS